MWSASTGFPTGRPAGAAPNTGAGIVVAESDSTVVGGLAASDRNTVSHNRGWGIEVWGAAVYPGQFEPYGTTVIGNAVGVTAAGAAAGAGNGLGGILIRSSRSNTVGVPGAGNVVGGNGTLAARGTGHGVAVVGGSFNRLDANRIGLDATGAPAPNEGAGVYVERSVSTRVGALANGPAEYNVVAYNGGAGVQIGASPTENGQLSNQTTLRYANLFANGGLEVDLGGDGRTANDPGDTDAGPNGLQNFPVIAEIVPSGSGFAARLTMAATAGQRYTFTFYRGGAPGADGQTPQALYLGEQEATASGTALSVSTLAIPGLAPGDFLVVAASSAAADGGVGELSDPVQVARGLPAGALVVNSDQDTNDGACDAANCTLREAIDAANANPDASFIGFRINTDGSPTITLRGQLPAITTPVEIDGFTQTESIRPEPDRLPVTYGVIINGRVASASIGFASGFRIERGGSVLRGLAISGFSGSAINIAGQNAIGNRIEGNLIGRMNSEAPSGTICNPDRADRNTTGILIDGGATLNVVGGALPSQANTIVCSKSGSSVFGVSRGIGVHITNSELNIVRGNFIGTTAALIGLTDLGNETAGVKVDGPSADFNVIEGNDIAFNGFRLAEDGRTDRDAGIVVSFGADDTAILRNAIGRNRLGIQVGDDEQTTNNENVEQRTRIESNGIGYARFRLGRAGWTVEPNAIGIAIKGASGTEIGGPGTGERNVITGNLATGILVQDQIGTGTRIRGNLIGTDETGNAVPAGGGNVGFGIFVGLGSSSGPQDRVQRLDVGGAEPGEGNVIAGSRRIDGQTNIIGAGVLVEDSGGVVTEGNGQTTNRTPVDIRILGNRIGVGTDGAALGNAGPGIDIKGSRGITVGRWGDPEAGNVIAHNGGAGVRVRDTAVSGLTVRSDRNTIEGNFSFANRGLGIDLVAPTREPASGWNMADPNDADNGPNGLLNYPSIEAVEIRDGTARLRVTLYGARDSDLRVRLYAGGERDPSGSGEGLFPLEDVRVAGQPLGVLRTDRNGRRVVTTDPVQIAPGQFVSGTVTDAQGNTSEFGYAHEVTTASVEVQVTNGSAGTRALGQTVDVWLDGPTGRIDIASGLGFGVASGRRQIPPGTYTVRGIVVPTGQRLAEQRITVASGESRRVDLFVLGNPAPTPGGTFVPTPGGTRSECNPNGTSTLEEIIRLCPPKRAAPSGAPVGAPGDAAGAVVQTFVANGVSDAPPLDVTVRGTGQVLARGLAFGDYSEFASVPDGPADIEVRRASDGVVLYVARIDFAGFGGDRVPLLLGGFLDPGGNFGGPGLELIGVPGGGPLGVVGNEGSPTETAPTVLALGAPHPNPTRGGVRVGFELPESSSVRVSVVDALGREVAVLADGEWGAGRHEATLAAGRLAPGVYVVRLVAGEAALVRRLTVVR